MRINSLVISLALLCAGCGSTQLLNDHQITMLSLKGCIPISEMTKSTTPVEMFVSAHECIEKENYAEAVKLNSMMFVYGKYDTLRVEDRSAHSALGFLSNASSNKVLSLSQEKRDNIQSQFNNLDRSAICEIALNLGNPSYFPSYMINHGMGSLKSSNSSNGLKDNFDPDQAWHEVLTTYVKCPTEIYPGN